MSLPNIDPKFALALSQALKKGLQGAREGTEPGVYRDIEIELVVTVGEMRVAPDTDKAPTCSIPLLTTCALLLQKFQPHDRAKALEVLRQVMTEAHDMGKDAQQQLLDSSGVAEIEKTIKNEIIGKLPRTSVKGAVVVKDESVTIKRMNCR